MFKLKNLLIGISLGLVYGVILRTLSGLPDYKILLEIMSLGFMIFGPLAMGWICVSFATHGRLPFWKSFILPSVPVLLGCFVTFALNYEGIICIAMYLPLGILWAGIGGVLSQMIQKRRNAAMAIFMLPFLSQFVENKVEFATQSHKVLNQIEIASTPEKVWNEIKSVRTISKDELTDSWIHYIGFPRPLDAEIDKEGVGGIRTARFERGLVFVETVDQWKPNELLSFRIDIDPKDIPPQALDEHVTIGGPYFDILQGTYKIEANNKGGVTLSLESNFRLSTHFNNYAGKWTDLIMHQIQSDILSVIQKRAEL